MDTGKKSWKKSGLSVETSLGGAAGQRGEGQGNGTGRNRWEGGRSQMDPALSDQKILK